MGDRQMDVSQAEQEELGSTSPMELQKIFKELLSQFVSLGSKTTLQTIYQQCFAREVFDIEDYEAMVLKLENGTHSKGWEHFAIFVYQKLDKLPIIFNILNEQECYRSLNIHTLIAGSVLR